MDALRRLIIGLFGLAVGLTSSILYMVYGWGLAPHSWVAIIGFGFFGHLFAHLIVEIAKSDE